MFQYVNHYECDRCHHLWADEWDCMCDDRCPLCSLEMTPYLSYDRVIGCTYDHRKAVA
jgi:hypothetical protein